MKPYQWSDLELRPLIALQQIAREGSFWAAAERLDCSASALSQQIAALERLVGHRLIDRSPGRRRVALTDPGRLLVRHAEAIAARLQAARADLVAFGEGEAATLRVGILESIGTRVLPELLRAFAAEWPRVDLRLAEFRDERLIEALETGEVDVSFAVLPLPAGPFESVTLMADPHLLMVAEGSPLAGKIVVEPSDLDGRPMIGGHPVAGYRDQVESFLRAEGVRPKYVFRSDDNGVVQSLVGAGLGVSIAPGLAVDRRDPAVRLVEIAGIPPRMLALAWHRDRYRSPAAEAFTKHALDVCARIDQAR